MQSLMDYTKHQVEIGGLEGIKVNNKTTICIFLFADDMGVFISGEENNFRKLQETLHI